MAGETPFVCVCAWGGTQSDFKITACDMMKLEKEALNFDVSF